MISIFSRITNSIKGRFSVPVPLVGRWSNDEDFTKKNTKIDLANEDNCFCHEYITEKSKKNIDENNVDVTESCINMEAAVDKANKDGFIPLHSASITDHVDGK